ncbi:hypothetical protein ACFFIY_04845 [Bhargavaea ullalensis]|uniref:Uncharacterized protein n=1 Tax=Bhargavaea ullalensis TaxID=1265685 RepID=A0ABV2G9Q9_9BACL
MNLNERIARTVQGARGGIVDDVPLEDIFQDEWIRTHTSFASYVEFARQAPETFQRAATPKKVKKKEMDPFIRAHSCFENWQEFLNQAGKELGIKRLREQGFNL